MRARYRGQDVLSVLLQGRGVRRRVQASAAAQRATEGGFRRALSSSQ